MYESPHVTVMSTISIHVLILGVPFINVRNAFLNFPTFHLSGVATLQGELYVSVIRIVDLSSKSSSSSIFIEGLMYNSVPFP